MSAPFGEQLRRARRACGLSQRALAEAIGIDSTYLSKLENNRVPPPAPRTVVRIAAALGLDAIALLVARRPVPAALAELTPAQWVALNEWLKGLAG